MSAVCEHDLEFAQRLQAVEDKAARNEGRIKKLEEHNNVLQKLVTAVEVMATKQDGLSQSVDKLTNKVESLESEPAKKWRFVVEKSIYFVIGAVIAYVLSQVGL